jgi:hypothetical protein
MTRPPKKSATLEIRLPHAVKEAFMARCRAEGSSASDVLRAFIDAHLARLQPQEPSMHAFKPLVRPALAAGALIAISAVFVFAATGPSRAAPDLRTAFNRLDRNHDGQLTLEEFRAAQEGDTVFLAAAPPPAAAAPAGPSPGPIMIPLNGPPPTPPEGMARPSPEVAQSLARREFGRMDMDANPASRSRSSRPAIGR